MIDKEFPGILKKYEPFRVENDIFIKLLIKHSSHGSYQSFLKEFSEKLSLNMEPLFAFPVRWKKIVFDTTDYILKNYRIKFGQADPFIAKLEEISIARKFLNGEDIFDYSLSFSKKASKDILDRLMTEAYLDYKEEDENGKKIVVEFDVKTELLENVQQEQLDASIF